MALPNSELDTRLLLFEIEHGSPARANNAFNKLCKQMNPKLKKLCAKFRIPRYNKKDVHQEALYALRFAGVRDYPVLTAVTPFERFALLRVRRHLANCLKDGYDGPMNSKPAF